MEKRYLGSLLAIGAAIAIVFSVGFTTLNASGCCRQNLAKAESVLRTQRWQNWRYAYARSVSIAVSDHAA